MNIDDNIFDFVYDAALRDAVLMKAYIGSKQELYKNEAARMTVKEYINRLFMGEYPDFYETEKAVEDSFKGYNPPFTFGNAQKLINMTAKYFFIGAYRNDSSRALFKECHCPMDSIMIEAIIKELDRIYAEADSAAKNEIKSLWKGNNRTFLRQSWSRIESSDISQYELFQDIVSYLSRRSGVLPIELDFILWN